jgi:nitrite reductase (NO-forming)
MQGELYSRQGIGATGHITYDAQRMLAAQPSFVVFNGKVRGLTGANAMTVNVGERARIFFADAGPNLISSFHVIGAIFDSVHPEGASEALHNVQTTLVPVAGATWVEFTFQVPGTYTLVDHALARSVDLGALAQITVTGTAQPGIFSAPPGQASSSH